MSKVKCIGLIAEDSSDFEAIKILVKRVLDRENLCFKKTVGNGCGRLRKKASDYATQLENRGCDMVVLIHDLDRNNYKDLFDDLSNKLKTTSVGKKYVCIPVEEIEAWFLSDPDAIKAEFKLSRNPKFIGLPETITSPKEKLEEQIYLCSNKSTIYLSTKHNEKLAKRISLKLVMQKCPSFASLRDFIINCKYK